MTSRTASTALPASLFPMSARLATWSTNSDFVTLGLLLGVRFVVGRRYQRIRMGRSQKPHGYRVLRASNLSRRGVRVLAHAGRARSLAVPPDGTASRLAPALARRADVRPRQAIERLRAEERRDRAARRPGDEQVAVAHLAR